MSLLDLRGVTHRYRSTSQTVLRDVSLTVGDDDIVAVVGESGCGKTTLGKIATGLVEASEGEVLFEGRNVAALKGAERQRYRRGVQIVHQDPYSSLNGALTIAENLGAPLRHHEHLRGKRLEAEVRRLLGTVGMDDSPALLRLFPHQLSGGQRQRVVIARAMSLRPRLVVADEPVSMLDVSVRVTILDLLLQLRSQQRMSFFFITHDLGVVRYFAAEGRTIVMFYGAVVEEGPTLDVLRHPKHPYTYLLGESIPVLDPALARARPPLSKLFASLQTGGSLQGCVFAPRCPFAEERCRLSRPPPLEVGAGRRVACFFPERVPEPSARRVSRNAAGGADIAANGLGVVDVGVAGPTGSPERSIGSWR